MSGHKYEIHNFFRDKLFETDLFKDNGTETTIPEVDPEEEYAKVMNIKLVSKPIDTTILARKEVADLIKVLLIKHNYVVEKTQKVNELTTEIQDLTKKKNELAKLNKYIDKFQNYPIICLPQTMTILEYGNRRKYIQNLYKFQQGGYTGHAETPERRSQNPDYYELDQYMLPHIDNNKRDEYAKKILKIFNNEAAEKASD